MKKILFALITVACLTLAQAQSSFTINMSGSQEAPTPNASPATGSGTATYNAGAGTLTINNLVYSGLTANSTASHIHGPGAPGVSAGVIYPFSAPMFVSGTTAGTINGTITLVTNPNATTYSLAQQIADLQAGLWYVNIHDGNFPLGEIRGQIVPVPEPSSFALIGLGLGVAALRLRRRQ